MERIKSGDDFDVRPKKKGSSASVSKWLLLAGFLGVTFVLCAIFYVWLYIQQVQDGYRLAKYYEENEQLLAIQRKLRLEWTRFQDPSLLEELGRKQFGLSPPKSDRKMILR